MADRHASPVKVLRGLAVATAAAMALASTAIRLHWNPWLILALIQLHALCSSPTWSISSTIVLSQLQDSKRQFGPIRAMATFGWMSGCWVVSLLGADASPLSGYSGALVWLSVAAFTLVLPSVEPPKLPGRASLRERLGLDALALLSNRDHRVVFLTAALLAVPIAGFYPFTPPQLRETGFLRTTAWMSLGQVTEMIAMFSLGALFWHWRLKWIFACGISFAVLRFALCAVPGKGWLLSGILLHGVSYTLVFITAQIYLDDRVDAAWRARGQALLSLMSSGVGNLLGYLGTGWWFGLCTGETGTRWPAFWAGLALAAAAVLIYFLTSYRGIGSGLAPARKPMLRR